MTVKKLLLVTMLLGTVWQVGCSPRYHRGPVTDHFDGTRFYHPGAPMNKGFTDFLRWRLTRTPEPWPDYRELPFTDKPPLRVEGSGLRLAFVGHVSVLIQTQGLNILLDPVWSDRASPLTWAGPRRVHPPGIRFEDLPKVDLILISHNHYDHLDLETIGRLWRRDQPRIITPLGNDTIIRSHSADIRVEAYDWGQQAEITPGVTVHLEPMQHWSARGLFDRNRALWAAFVLATSGGRIYYVGDSGYGNGATFRQARETHGPFRLAVLPIGSYEPRWFMAYQHMNPEESVLAFKDLGQPFTLPTHYGVFQLADTGYDTPLRDLRAAMARHAAPEGRIRPLRPGEHWWIP